MALTTDARLGAGSPLEPLAFVKLLIGTVERTGLVADTLEGDFGAVPAEVLLRLTLESLLNRPVALAPAAKSSFGILGCWPDNFDLSSHSIVSSN